MERRIHFRIFLSLAVNCENKLLKVYFVPNFKKSPDEKVTSFIKISYFLAGRLDFLPTTLMLSGKPWDVSPINHKV